MIKTATINIGTWTNQGRLIQMTGMLRQQDVSEVMDHGKVNVAVLSLQAFVRFNRAIAFIPDRMLLSVGSFAFRLFRKSFMMLPKKK